MRNYRILARNCTIATKRKERILELLSECQALRGFFPLPSSQSKTMNSGQKLQPSETKIPTTQELLELIAQEKFIWHQAPPYVDESGSFAGVPDSQIWTDAWIPIEIAEVAGVPDTNWGIDYYEAEFIYPDRQKVINDHPDLIDLVLFGFD